VIEKVRLLGIDPEELLAAKGRTKRSAVKPKYRDKRDPTQTWSGRGRPPRWLHERINAGENNDDYLIQKRPLACSGLHDATRFLMRRPPSAQRHRQPASGKYLISHGLCRSTCRKKPVR
jgi:H-NS histone family